MLAALLLLASCATGPFKKPSPRPSGCVSYFTYEQTTLDQAAHEYEHLPDGGLRILTDDYSVVRAETRAAGCS